MFPRTKKNGADISYVTHLRVVHEALHASATPRLAAFERKCQPDCQSRFGVGALRLAPFVASSLGGRNWKANPMASFWTLAQWPYTDESVHFGNSDHKDCGLSLAVTPWLVCSVQWQLVTGFRDVKSI